MTDLLTQSTSLELLPETTTINDEAVSDRSDRYNKVLSALGALSFSRTGLSEEDVNTLFPQIKNEIDVGNEAVGIVTGKQPHR